MVQQLIREGNILKRFLKASPMGLIVSTMCKFFRTRSVNKLYAASGELSILAP